MLFAHVPSHEMRKGFKFTAYLGALIVIVEYPATVPQAKAPAP